MADKKRKRQINKKTVMKLVVTLFVVAAVIAAAVFFLRKKVKEEYAEDPSESIQTAEVTKGSVSTTVYGDGTLADEETETITIPSGVELTSLAVRKGDTVSEGDLLAQVSGESVLSAMADLQNQIDELDVQIEEAADNEVSESLTTAVSGRVKLINAQAGDDVTAVMYQSGALALLSLDGYMKTEIETDAAAEGDDVTVMASDGSNYSGTVSAVNGNRAVILLTDYGPVYQDTVTVTDEEGTEIGSGTLEINDMLSITGYGGTIETVNVSLDETVSADAELFTLTDTAYTAGYETLLSEREELTESMKKLADIYKKDALYAEISGTIKSAPDLEEETATEDSSSETGTTDEALTFTISPDETMTLSVSIDETDILSLEEGQEAQVTIDSLGETVYTGTITEIDKSGTSADGVTSYTASVQINKEEGMLSGMSATAAILIESADDVLLIPTDALQKTSASYYVYTSYDEETGELGGMKEIQIGVSGTEYTEVKEGLSEGESICYAEEETTDRGMQGQPGGGNFGGGMPDGQPGGGQQGGNRPEGGDRGGNSGNSGRQGGNSQGPGRSGQGGAGQP